MTEAPSPGLHHELYIGLMSGTSIDAIDAALVEFSGNTCKSLGAIQHPIPAPLREDIVQLCQPGDDNIDLLGRTDRALAMLFSQACTRLISQCGVAPAQVTAIGSHGQTVRHRPGVAASPGHFTLQIGDPSTIAVLTGITTVADFRRKDMARGGQGAPLVPGFHRFLFHSPEANRVVINIGGIANISWLPSDGEVIGFDTGPGNRLLDIWASRHLDQPFDSEGAWARSGVLRNDLLESLLRHPFLDRLPPKSTGREDFNSTWLLDQLAGCMDRYQPADVQSTLAWFTARTIVNSFNFLPEQVDAVFVCGGGARNTHLMEILQQLCREIPVRSTADLGMPPQQVESAAFAWLARQTLNRLPGALSSVTGARGDSVLGGIFHP